MVELVCECQWRNVTEKYRIREGARRRSRRDRRVECERMKFILSSVLMPPQVSL